MGGHPMGISGRFKSIDVQWNIQWTVDMVADEAKKRARQIAEIGQLEKNREIQIEGSPMRSEDQKPR
jgi:hypothetical protein